ncbi:ABC transporter ATP-binding protein [candidate division WOR-3 bacterium]|nr:ABC transporter ATP-binding protein [candidate division WOR-3 bacterium]
MIRYFVWISRFWRMHKLHIVFLVFFTVISSAVALSFPLVFKFLLDEIENVLAGTSMSEQFKKTLLFLGALALAKFIAGLYPGARAWLNSKIGLNVRDLVFKSMLSKDYRFFNEFKPGDLATRLTDDIVEHPRIAWFSCSAVFRALESTSKLAFCLAVMFYMNRQLTMIAIFPLPFMLYLFYLIQNKLGRIVMENRKATSRTNDLLDSTFAGISIIKAYRAEKGQKKRLRELLDRRLKIDLKIAKYLMFVHSAYSVLGQIGKVVVMFVGGLFVVRGTIGVGEFYAFYVYLDMILAPMMDIPNLFVTSKQAFISIDRENEILDFPLSLQTSGSVETGKIESIKFEDAGFIYEGEKGVRGIDFKGSKGDVIAVVGEIGSGKSTLLKMMTGLLPVSEGRYFVNGLEMENYSRESYLSEIGYVPQESLLFSETIRENVKIGRALGEDAVIEALSAVNITSREINGGAAAKLQQAGVGVSGGQKQRVAIARAIANKPSLILFDDCTSALDSKNEESLWKYLKERYSKSLMIVVSHRLATIKQSDKVLFIHRGRQLAFERHEDLMKASSLYRMILASEAK